MVQDRLGGREKSMYHGDDRPLSLCITCHFGYLLVLMLLLILYVRGVNIVKNVCVLWR